MVFCIPGPFTSAGRGWRYDLLPTYNWGFPGGFDSKEFALNDWGSIPRSGRSPGEENDNTLQYSCLENPMEEELGVLQSMGSQSQTPLSDSDFHFLLQAGASGAIEIRATNCPRWLVQQGEKGSGTLALSSRMFCSFQVDQA